MEIKLTADWIILHNSEVFAYYGKGCFRILNNDFQYHLIELALKTLNVQYECEEHYDESDEDFKEISYYYSFENIEDIKDSCPELYKKFQEQIKTEIEWEKEWKNKQDIILKFLDVPKTQNQIHKYLEDEIYKYDVDYETTKKWPKNYTDFLIKDLLCCDLIKKETNKYSLA